MRVLVLSPDPGIPLYGPSGASAHLRGVVRAFAERGDQVRVAVARTGGHGGPPHEVVPAEVVTFAPRNWAWLPRVWRERGETWDARRLLAAGLDGFAPDLVWERHSLFSGPHDLDCAHVLEVNAPLAIERPRIGRVFSPAYAEETERAAILGAKRVVTVSAWLARWARELGATDVRHVPNGVEPEGPGDREATRDRLGLTGLVVGFVGSMKPWHGLDRLPAILDALPEATALLVGDGPVSPPAHPRIRAVGRVPQRELRHLVAAMDVGLAPYAADAPPWFCPLKILAYQAQGVPVVAADVGDCALLVQRASGSIAPTDDPAAWASAVRSAAALPRIVALRTWADVLRDAGL
jgi:glycosyltransferase involved in cell wall biosynthesis